MMKDKMGRKAADARKSASVRGKVSISVRRANGRVDKIGVIAGGTWWENLVAHVRLWIANMRSRRGW